VSGPGGEAATGSFAPAPEQLDAVRARYPHAHREGDRCSSACPFYGNAWRVFPQSWPTDAEAITDAIIAAREAVTAARRAIQDAAALIGDTDAERPLRDAQGCMTAALVVLYPEVATWRGRHRDRACIDVLYPTAKGRVTHE
jgi:hypothetical protein